MKRKEPLPSYIIDLYPNSDNPPYDSCFVSVGYLFPESREELAPYREFPLPKPFYSVSKEQKSASYSDILKVSDDDDLSAFDSTILQISEMDELLLDVQALGLQYVLHIQSILRDDWVIAAPRIWDQEQVLLTCLPVFTQELCQWHYPQAQIGYNTMNTEPPFVIDSQNNVPQMFGYLPNGDLVVYWELGEVLHSEFGVELEALRSSIDGVNFILSPGMEQSVALRAPAGDPCVTGLMLGARDSYALDSTVSYVESISGTRPLVFRGAPNMFYRLRLPVIQSEWDFNCYGDATWGAFGYRSKRLMGFEFKVDNNPFSRFLPIFSTEHGNLVASVEFYKRLSELLRYLGVNVGMRTIPIQRIP